jgi:hypothetical protein
MSFPTTLQGGTQSAPNRAPAAKVIAGALANERVAQALIAALGADSISGAIVATSTSQTVNFGSLQVGDVLVHIPASPGNVQFGVVATAGMSPFAAVIGDLYLDLRAVNLDSNNQIVPAGGGNTGNGGTEF